MAQEKRQTFQPLDDELVELVIKIADSLAKEERQLTPDGQLSLKVNAPQIQLIYKSLYLLSEIDKRLKSTDRTQE